MRAGHQLSSESICLPRAECLTSLTHAFGLSLSVTIQIGIFFREGVTVLAGHLWGALWPLQLNISVPLIGQVRSTNLAHSQHLPILTVINIRVFFVKWMTMLAHGLARIFGIERLASQFVLGGGDCFKMCWIHAGTIAAEMIEYQILGNWSICQLIRIPMSVYPFAMGNREPTVTSGPCAGGPFPATVLGFSHLRPETQFLVQFITSQMMFYS